MKPANLKANRVDRRFLANQSGKRKAVIVIRERDGSTLPAVFRSEGAALSFVKSRIAKGTIVNADDSPNWNELHSRFEMKRIDHQEAYSAPALPPAALHARPYPPAALPATP